MRIWKTKAFSKFATEQGAIELYLNKLEDEYDFVEFEAEFETTPNTIVVVVSCHSYEASEDREEKIEAAIAWNLMNEHI
jgi:hypothetical protein